MSGRCTFVRFPSHSSHFDTSAKYFNWHHVFSLLPSAPSASPTLFYYTPTALDNKHFLPTRPVLPAPRFPAPSDASSACAACGGSVLLSHRECSTCHRVFCKSCELQRLFLKGRRGCSMRRRPREVPRDLRRLLFDSLRSVERRQDRSLLHATLSLHRVVFSPVLSFVACCECVGKPRSRFRRVDMQSVESDGAVKSGCRRFCRGTRRFRTEDRLVRRIPRK